MKKKIPTTKSDLKKAANTALDKTTKTAKNLAVNPMTYKVLGGVLVGFLLYKGIKGIGEKLVGEPIDNQVNGTGGSSAGATITQTEANNYAQQLLDAFNSMFPMYGTDDATILDVFKKFQNPADFIKVYNAFGTKDYNGWNSPPIGVWEYLDSFDKRNLVYWLKSELSDSEGDPVYTLVKTVVNAAGFSF